MKQWIHKLIVVFVAVMTLGLYIPPTSLNPEAEEGKDPVLSKADISQNTIFSTIDEPSADEEESPSGQNITDLTDKAKELTIRKFGPRIADRVEADFMTEILPHMEEAMQQIMEDNHADGSIPPYYAITENPSSGVGERIFNIRDNHTGQDIAKFHVRRENRPLEGYWFNFHYHLNEDQFESHHEIGELFWDKNTPPKWMV